MSTNTTSKKTLLSAIQPTSQLTLGNYLGALRPWAQLYSQYDCLFFAVDLHAITAAKPSREELQANTYRAIATSIACGIDPEQSTFFVQSHVPEHTELAWILTCFSSMGELTRMTQFKDKSVKHGTHIPTGLFTYPLLMAADILLYQTHLVPVGGDQKQHLELTRDLAERINNHVRGAGAAKDEVPLFRVPEASIPSVGARIMSLQNPAVKMSKSDPDPQGVVFLSDSDTVIEKKFKRAVTDSGSEITDSLEQPGIHNLLTIQSALTGKTLPELVAGYAGKQYGHLKMETAQIVTQHLRPIREKTDLLLGDLSALDQVLARGAASARERAQKTLKRVYEKLGFLPLASVRPSIRI